MDDLTETQKKILDAYNECGHSEYTVARELGLDKNSVIKSLWAAGKKGHSVFPNRFCEHAPAGFGLTKSTMKVDGNGKVLIKWDRVAPLEQQTEEITEYLNHRITAAIPVLAPSETKSEILAELLVMDPHIGLKTWGKESGENYDLKIHQSLYSRVAQKAFQLTGSVDTIILVFGGDNIHIDSNLAMTEKSHHRLLADNRHMKVAMYFVETATTMIDTALLNAKSVVVHVLRGNHDPNSADMMTLILWAYYRDEKRVAINTSPSKHKYFQWGATFFGYSHGDTGRGRLGPYMMREAMRLGDPGIKWIRVQLGHLHKRKRSAPAGMDENDGTIIEHFPTMCPADAYASEEAFLSSRAVVVNTYHKKFGLRSRAEISPEELKEF